MGKTPLTFHAYRHKETQKQKNTKPFEMQPLKRAVYPLSFSPSICSLFHYLSSPQYPTEIADAKYCPESDSLFILYIFFK